MVRNKEWHHRAESSDESRGINQPPDVVVGEFIFTGLPRPELYSLSSLRQPVDFHVL